MEMHRGPVLGLAGFGPGNGGIHRQDVGGRQLVGKPDAHRRVPAGDNQAAEMGLGIGGLGGIPIAPQGVGPGSSGWSCWVNWLMAT